MPMYDYVCRDCNEHFEEMRSVADREFIKCVACDGTAAMMILVAPRLSAAMGLDPSFPSAAAKWRAAAERRGRGEDMTSANKDVQDEGIHREAFAARAERGTNKVFVS